MALKLYRGAAFTNRVMKDIYIYTYTHSSERQDFSLWAYADNLS